MAYYQLVYVHVFYKLSWPKNTINNQKSDFTQPLIFGFGPPCCKLIFRPVYSSIHGNDYDQLKADELRIPKIPNILGGNGWVTQWA